MTELTGRQQPMTICLVSLEYPPETTGGIGTQTFLKAHGLAQRGHSVHVISSTYDGVDSTSIDGDVTVHRVLHPACDTLFSEPSVHWVGYSWAVARKLHRLTQDVTFDLVEFPEYGAEGFIYQLEAARYRRVPVVVMLHGSLAMFAERVGWPPADSAFYRFGTLMEESVVRGADLLLSASRNIARFWNERCGIPLGKIEVVHTAVDAEQFVPGGPPRTRRPTVLFVGRLDGAKGLFAVAEAVLRLKRNHPDILFRMVGRGDDENMALLQQRIAASGAPHAFEVTGHVPYDRLPAYYCDADVFASPAAQEHGVASAYLEALACETPVIACNTGGAPEAVVDGETGFLVPPGDLEALTAALDRLLSDAALRDRLGRNGRQRVLSYFSVEKHVQRVEAVYRRLLVSRDRPGAVRSSVAGSEEQAR